MLSVLLAKIFLQEMYVECFALPRAYRPGLPLVNSSCLHLYSTALYDEAT